MKVLSGWKVTLVSKNTVKTTALKSIDYAVKKTADVTLHTSNLHLNMPKVHQC